MIDYITHESVSCHSSSPIHIMLDGTEIDMARDLITCHGAEVTLTNMERELLYVLLTNANTALSREKLLKLAWGFSFMGGTRTIDVHIWKLRHKLHWEHRIQTVYKLGYRLETY